MLTPVVERQPQPKPSGNPTKRCALHVTARITRRQFNRVDDRAIVIIGNLVIILVFNRLRVFQDLGSSHFSVDIALSSGNPQPSYQKQAIAAQLQIADLLCPARGIFIENLINLTLGNVEDRHFTLVTGL